LLEKVYCKLVTLGAEALCP